VQIFQYFYDFHDQFYVKNKTKASFLDFKASTQVSGVFNWLFCGPKELPNR
jgi:hypothetical protein